jgi:hypothetical protein
MILRACQGTSLHRPVGVEQEGVRPKLERQVNNSLEYLKRPQTYHKCIYGPTITLCGSVPTQEASRLGGKIPVKIDLSSETIEGFS